jgi:biotin carboxylase
MVKPVDLTGGKGISTISNSSGFKQAIKHSTELSKLSSVVIEEFFDGTLHSYSTIIKNSKIVFEYADNEYCHPTPYLVSTSTSIVSVPLNILSDLKRATELVAKKLNLIDGVLHCQFLYRDGEYRILEYTRRCSGDLYSTVVELVTGLSHADIFIQQSLGYNLSFTYNKPISPFVSRHCVFPKNSGLFKGISISFKLDKYVHSTTSAFLKNYHFKESMAEKAGVIILSYNTQATMLEMTNELNNLIQCEVL